jgi:hypothetical protein
MGLGNKGGDLSNWIWNTRHLFIVGEVTKAAGVIIEPNHSVSYASKDRRHDRGSVPSRKKNGVDKAE